MGNFFTSGASNFHWEYTEEPHASRRVEILRKYPQIKKLMKTSGDRLMVLHGLTFLIAQISLGFYANTLSCPVRFFLSVCVGNWLASMMQFHLHEASHGLIFGPNSVWKNRVYGMIMNLGLGVPFFSFFKRHHKKHHKYIGDDVLDAEYPSEIEARLFGGTTFGKYSWLALQPFIYTSRTPTLIIKRPNWWWDGEELTNFALVCSFSALCFYTDQAFLWGHLAMSTLTSSASNLFGYWGTVSHIEFFRMRETSSYYGWLNVLFLNVGFHMEHHDFPNIPSRYLPEIKKIAPEYYEDGVHLDSFHSAIIKFVFDPKMSVSSYLRRENVAGQFEKMIDVNNNRTISNKKIQ